MEWIAAGAFAMRYPLGSVSTLSACDCRNTIDWVQPASKQRCNATMKRINRAGSSFMAESPPKFRPQLQLLSPFLVQWLLQNHTFATGRSYQHRYHQRNRPYGYYQAECTR